MIMPTPRGRCAGVRLGANVYQTFDNGGEENGQAREQTRVAASLAAGYANWQSETNYE
jgi:hypothetical protein